MKQTLADRVGPDTLCKNDDVRLFWPEKGPAYGGQCTYDRAREAVRLHVIGWVQSPVHLVRLLRYVRVQVRRGVRAA